MAAQFVDGPAEVTLRLPPPLERSMDVREEGDKVALIDGDKVVAEARRGGPQPGRAGAGGRRRG